MSQDFDAFLAQDRRAAASAFVKGDAARVVALSAASGQATFFDPGGGFTEGAAAINQANAEGAARFGPRSTTELVVKDKDASGELAFWTGYQRADIDLEGQLQAMNLRVTEVFRKVAGEWKLIHRHASKAADAAA